MAVPTGVLWPRDPHTAAKHALLRCYTSAWFPIMARQFCLVDLRVRPVTTVAEARARSK